MSRTRPLLPLAVLVLFSGCADIPTAAVTETAASHANDVHASSSSVTVVMSNLANPRGLAWGPDGALYVAEAGSPEPNGPCVPYADGTACYVGSGAVSRLWNGQQERVLTGLPSVFYSERNDLAGPHHIAFAPDGSGVLTIGLGADPAVRDSLGEVARHLGTLLRFDGSGNRLFIDIAGFEQSHNPDGRHVDSNPYGVYAEAGRHFVTDAGGNSLLEVAADGTISVVSVFGTIPVPPGPFNPPFAQSDPVPTQVRRGPDGALYVSALTGVPFLPGTAGIYRIVSGQTPRLRGEFTAITDFTFAPDGSGYLVQFASQPFLGGAGALIHVARDGTRTVIADDLIAPTGVTIGPDGALYVTNRSVIPGQGEVLRIVP